MKITGIDVDIVHVNHRGNWVFVHVNTDEGIRGLGELSPSGPKAGCLAVLHRMADALEGRDPRRIEHIVSSFTPMDLDRAGVLALSAVEQALWDILGKSLGVPVYTLLGGSCHDEIHLYANINRATTDRTPEGFARNAAAAVADGFDAVKLAPFDGMPRGIDRAQDAEPGIACMRAVREAIGPDVKLLIDCHSHFTAAGALEVADALRELDLFWFEEPVPDDDIDGYLEVKAHCGMPVAGGESRQLRRGFWETLQRRTVDILMPDVTIVGGIGELKKVADMAATHSIPTAPHGPFGPVTIAAGVHAMAAHPGFMILEYAWGEVPWRHDLTIPSETINNGRISLPDAPGLGVELNPDVVETHRAE